MKIIHGMVGTPTYNSWVGMKTRCLCKTYKRFADYGGRGITVCRRWLKFENFFADMGLRPEGKTLNRKNNNGNYTPINCTWSSQTEQSRNTRTNKLVSYRGSTYCLSEWAEKLGVTHKVLSTRLERGWSIERAFSHKVWRDKSKMQRHGARAKMVTFQGKTKPLIEWSEITGLRYLTIAMRLNRGWTPEEAFTHAITHSRKGRIKL